MTDPSVPQHDDTFFDMTEVREAMASPLYRTSARYRDEIAAKLIRSQQAGTVGRIAEMITTDQRSHTIHASNTKEGIYGGAVPMPKSASPLGMYVGTFSSLDEIRAAMHAPSYADPTYRRALVERIERSARERTLDEAALAQVSAWKAAVVSGDKVSA
jgi:hypothetical protein